MSVTTKDLILLKLPSFFESYANFVICRVFVVDVGCEILFLTIHFLGLLPLQLFFCSLDDFNEGEGQSGNLEG